MPRRRDGRGKGRAVPQQNRGKNAQRTPRNSRPVTTATRATAASTDRQASGLAVRALVALAVQNAEPQMRQQARRTAARAPGGGQRAWGVHKAFENANAEVHDRFPPRHMKRAFWLRIVIKRETPSPSEDLIPEPLARVNELLDKHNRATIPPDAVKNVFIANQPGTRRTHVVYAAAIDVKAKDLRENLLSSTGVLELSNELPGAGERNSSTVVTITDFVRRQNKHEDRELRRAERQLVDMYRDCGAVEILRATLSGESALVTGQLSNAGAALARALLSGAPAPLTTVTEPTRSPRRAHTAVNADPAATQHEHRPPSQLESMSTAEELESAAAVRAVLTATELPRKHALRAAGLTHVYSQRDAVSCGPAAIATAIPTQPPRTVDQCLAVVRSRLPAGTVDASEARAQGLSVPEVHHYVAKAVNAQYVYAGTAQSAADIAGDLTQWLASGSAVSEAFGGLPSSRTAGAELAANFDMVLLQTSTSGKGGHWTLAVRVPKPGAEAARQEHMWYHVDSTTRPPGLWDQVIAPGDLLTRLRNSLDRDGSAVSFVAWPRHACDSLPFAEAARAPSTRPPSSSSPPANGAESASSAPKNKTCRSSTPGSGRTDKRAQLAATRQWSKRSSGRSTRSTQRNDAGKRRGGAIRASRGKPYGRRRGGATGASRGKPHGKRRGGATSASRGKPHDKRRGGATGARAGKPRGSATSKNNGRRSGTTSVTTRPPRASAPANRAQVHHRDPPAVNAEQQQCLAESSSAAIAQRSPSPGKPIANAESPSTRTSPTAISAPTRVSSLVETPPQRDNDHASHDNDSQRQDEPSSGSAGGSGAATDTTAQQASGGDAAVGTAQQPDDDPPAVATPPPAEPDEPGLTSARNGSETAGAAADTTTQQAGGGDAAVGTAQRPDGNPSAVATPPLAEPDAPGLASARDGSETAGEGDDAASDFTALSLTPSTDPNGAGHSGSRVELRQAARQLWLATTEPVEARPWLQQALGANDVWTARELCTTAHTLSKLQNKAEPPSSEGKRRTSVKFNRMLLLGVQPAEESDGPSTETTAVASEDMHPPSMTLMKAELWWTGSEAGGHWSKVDLMVAGWAELDGDAETAAMWSSHLHGDSTATLYMWKDGTGQKPQGF